MYKFKSELNLLTSHFENTPTLSSYLSICKHEPNEVFVIVETLKCYSTVLYTKKNVTELNFRLIAGQRSQKHMGSKRPERLKYENRFEKTTRRSLFAPPSWRELLSIETANFYIKT